MALHGGEMVTCSVCGLTYELTPWHDYFDATTTTDGKCEACMLKAAGYRASKTETN